MLWRVISLCIGFVLVSLAVAIVWAWSPDPPWLRTVVAIAAGATLFVFGWWYEDGTGWWIARSLLLAMVVVLVLLPPRLDRQWRLDQAQTISVDRSSSAWVIDQVRMSRHQVSDDVHWGRLAIDPDRVDELWLLMCPFSPKGDLAHVWFSFGYRDADDQRRYVNVSTEIRREVGERFHPLMGCFNRYELIYIVSDEGDGVAMRTHALDAPTRLYRMNVPPEAASLLFRDYIDRAEQLGVRPEWYNSFFNSCASNMLGQARARFDSEPLGHEWDLNFPGRFDLVAWRRGLLVVPDTIRSGEELRAAYDIREHAQQADPSDPGFSEHIRSALPAR